MHIYTSPMCQEVVRLAGVSTYTVKKNNNFDGADLAIVLSETVTEVPAIKVKLNTFKQIFDSVDFISNHLGTEKLDMGDWESVYLSHIRPAKGKIDERKKIKVKVYSNFLKEIVADMGFTLVEDQADFMVYPDYLRKKISTEIEAAGDMAIEIPSHKNAPIDPLERAHMRYNILEKRLCTRL